MRLLEFLFGQRNPLFFDNYKRNLDGSLILIDEATNETVGAGNDL